MQRAVPSGSPGCHTRKVSTTSWDSGRWGQSGRGLDRVSGDCPSSGLRIGQNGQKNDPGHTLVICLDVHRLPPAGELIMDTTSRRIRHRTTPRVSGRAWRIGARAVGVYFGSMAVLNTVRTVRSLPISCSGCVTTPGCRPTGQSSAPWYRWPLPLSSARLPFRRLSPTNCCAAVGCPGHCGGRRPGSWD